MLCLNGVDILCCICVKSNMLVVMLIVKGDDIDCIIGLEFGVDDYVFKFCMLCEIVVCICVILCCVLVESSE